jgi:hypothetical protein
MNHERMLIAGVSAFLAVILIALCQYIYKNSKTHSILERTAFTAKHEHWQSSSNCSNVIDAWRKPISFECVSNELKTTYILTSSGRDGIMRTKDDIVCITTDLNKSRIAGEWVGKKSKQFAIGLFHGLRGGEENP